MLTIKPAGATFAANGQLLPSSKRTDPAPSIQSSDSGSDSDSDSSSNSSSGSDSESSSGSDSDSEKQKKQTPWVLRTRSKREPFLGIGGGSEARDEFRLSGLTTIANNAKTYPEKAHLLNNTPLSPVIIGSKHLLVKDPKRALTGQTVKYSKRGPTNNKLYTTWRMRGTVTIHVVPIRIAASSAAGRDCTPGTQVNILELDRTLKGVAQLITEFSSRLLTVKFVLVPGFLELTCADMVDKLSNIYSKALSLNGSLSPHRTNLVVVSPVRLGYAGIADGGSIGNGRLIMGMLPGDSYERNVFILTHELLHVFGATHPDGLHDIYTIMTESPTDRPLILDGASVYMMGWMKNAIYLSLHALAGHTAAHTDTFRLTTKYNHGLVIFKEVIGFSNGSLTHSMVYPVVVLTYRRDYIHIQQCTNTGILAIKFKTTARLRTAGYSATVTLPALPWYNGAGSTAIKPIAESLKVPVTLKDSFEGRQLKIQLLARTADEATVKVTFV